jgi:hypothetical protein
MSRVPSIPRKPPSDLDEIEAMINAPADEKLKLQAEFIREELARIGNEVDRPNKKP